MRLLLIFIFGFTALTSLGQTINPLKVDSELYSHAVDSLVKYILRKEKPSSIILDGDISILNAIPNNIQGQEIIKKSKRLKAKNNSVWITVNPLGGTMTRDKRSVFLVITKYVDGDRSSWEGYGGYNFDYAFNLTQNLYVLQEVTKSIIIR